MPRKFLGQRIEKGVDVLRPPSLTLTTEELMQIPSLPSSSSDESFTIADNKTKRLSRKLGGTIYFRKRLESVPEIFLHDLRKHENAERLKQKMDNSGPKVSIMPQILEQTSEKYVSYNEKRILQRGSRQVSQGIPYRYGIERPDTPVGTLYHERPKPIIKKLTDLDESNNTEALCKVSRQVHNRSTNEILFDEILDAYGDMNDNEASSSIPSVAQDSTKYQIDNSVLHSEIERVLKHVQKQQNVVEMNKRIESLEKNEQENSDSNEDNSSVASAHIKLLSDLISSREYATESGSDSWSQNDTSDIYSVETESNQDGYETAMDTIPSSLLIADLYIHDEASDTSSTSSCEKNPYKPNKRVRMKLNKVIINPVILELDFSEEQLDTEAPISDDPEDKAIHINTYGSGSTDSIQSLQTKIDNISLIDSDDAHTTTSSIYA